MTSCKTNSRGRRAHRGNTIVLVTAILVLLVIIATAFVGRTRAVRQISAAQQSSAGRDGRGESVAIDVANEIAQSLFAKPVATDPTTGGIVDQWIKVDESVDPPVVVASSSWPRLAPPLDAERYSIDRDVLSTQPPDVPNPFIGDGRPDHGYNFAPFEVKPWTNWPDSFDEFPTWPDLSTPWPFGPGSPNGALTDAVDNPIGDANPYGNPGYGDTRWLRSTEPDRRGFDLVGGDGRPDTFDFTHWTHLSWIPTANNGWRVVDDISDVMNGIPATTDQSLGVLDFLGSVDDTVSRAYAVAMPYEQWLPGRAPAPVQNANEFITRRNLWFNDYKNAYRNPTVALPNFFDLGRLGPGGAVSPPTDEFKRGTLRNAVSRTFTDTDGDGFTDSFWFLAPGGVDRGIRTLVGVSVVDNSALLNANVATKFSFDTTAGHTPSDLALVTSAAEYAPNGTLSTVGFLDGPINQQYTGTSAAAALPTYWGFSGGNPFLPASIQYDRNRFGDGSAEPLTFLSAIGMRSANGGVEQGDPASGFTLADPSLPAPGTNGALVTRGSFESARERLAYFKMGAGMPSVAGPSPVNGLTPFDASDEFELRAYHGNNVPFTFSRFEQAVSLYNPLLQGDQANVGQFLRSTPMRGENDEYLDQLSSQELLVDNRRKLTMFSGARNETAPPWTWATPYFDEYTNYISPNYADLAAGVPLPNDPEFAEFQDRNRREWFEQKFKIDLREPMFVDANGNAFVTADPDVGPRRNLEKAFDWRRRMQRLFERSLTRQWVDENDSTQYESVMGRGRNNYRRTMSMIASYVANLDCASDEPDMNFRTGDPGSPRTRADDDPLNPALPPISPATRFEPPIRDVVADPWNTERYYVGMEKQPFITEVFIGIVYLRSRFDQGLWTQLGGTPPPQTQNPVNDADRLEVLPPDVADGGEPFVDGSCHRALVIAVEIANPYDTPINLRDFKLRFFGKESPLIFLDGANPGSPGLNTLSEYPDGPILAPATLGRPSTAVVYWTTEADSLPGQTTPPFRVDPAPLQPGSPAVPVAMPLRQRFLDFLDLERGEVTGPGLPIDVAQDYDGDGFTEWVGPFNSRGEVPLDKYDRTLVFRAPGWKFPIWDPTPNVMSDPGSIGTPEYGGDMRTFINQYLAAQSSPDPSARKYAVELVRTIGDPQAPQNARDVVVDRFDHDEGGVEFVQDVERLFAREEYLPPRKRYEYSVAEPDRRYVAGIRIGPDNDCFMTWVRASRIWALDVDGWQDTATPFEDKNISALELSPRYVFSAATSSTFPFRSITGGVDEGGGSESFTGDVFGVSTDPDVFDETGTKASLWPRSVFFDPFGRLVRSKPVFFTNILVTKADAGGQPNAVYEIGGNPLPFIGDGINQRGRVTINGEEYDWITGAKGFSANQQGQISGASDIRRLASLPYMNVPFQMSQRDSDFEQVGEILDVFLWGHVIEGWSNSRTIRTFSEIMTITDQDDPLYPGEGIWINRLRFALSDEFGRGSGLPVFDARFEPSTTTLPLVPRIDYRPWVPSLPAGAGIFDALTIDGPGRNTFDRNADGIISPGSVPYPLSDLPASAEERSFRLAGGYSGRATPGLINVNTAPPEVMQALPMLTRVPRVDNPSSYSRLVDAIRSYRELGYFATPIPSVTAPFYVPDYGDRGLFEAQIAAALPTAFQTGVPRFFPGMRGERGFASIGELMLLARTPPPGPDIGARASYSIRWLALDPYDRTEDPDPAEFATQPVGYAFSIDRARSRPSQVPEDIFLRLAYPAVPNLPLKTMDEPLGDAEDASLLFKGISNLVTTRSDVFTVYLRVRQVKQNPVNGVWDGTNPDLIVDDTRYVMCVDRSGVDSPDDQPRIIYFQKCPD